MHLGRKKSSKTSSGTAYSQSIMLTGIAGRLAVALTLAGVLWLGSIWAVDLIPVG